MYVKVRVWPKCKKESVALISENRFEMKVKEPAERNLANTRVRELLAAEYKISLQAVRLVSGHHSPSKIFDIITG